MKKLVFKDSIIDLIIDLNFVCIVVMLLTRFTFFVYPSMFIFIISFILLKLFGGSKIWKKMR